MYDFKDLSPIDFEDLVRDILQAEFGVVFESFGPGPDSGVDCRHSLGADRTIVQAKHYVRTGKNGLLRALKGEVAKVTKLRPSRYIVATSVSLTPALKEKIRQAMPGVPLADSDILGQEDLNNLLQLHGEVLKRHYKLWLGSTHILERILSSGIYNRTDAEMEIIKGMIPKFVQNASVRDAEGILADSGALIITGHPGVGKTTLARMMVWLHAAQGWKVFVVDDITEAFEVANPGEKRLILFDDFLGQVRLSSDLVRGLDQRLPPFLHRVKSAKDLRFILTTRQYILSQAELLSRRLASKEMSAHQYVLNVGSYTRDVRAKILYNHLYFSKLSSSQIEEILGEDFFLKIIDHGNFNPRLIELLTSEDYAQLTGEGLRSAIERVLDNPDELWERPYRDHIGEDGRALMWALLLFPHSAFIPELREAFLRASAALGVQIPAAQLQPRFASALKELEGSVLSIFDQRIAFSNPGVRDFLQIIAIDDDVLPSLLAHSITLREVKQCWEIYSNRQPHPTPTAANAQRWIDALATTEIAHSSTPVDALILALDLYDHFTDDRLLACSQELADRIVEEGLDSNEASSVAEELGNLTFRQATLHEVDRLREKLTQALASFVANDAWELPLDELEVLDNALFDYGSDQDLAERSIHAALDAYIPEISSDMDDFSTLDELEDFEKRVKALITRRSYSGHSPSYSFSSKREYLEEKEAEQYDSERYRSMSPPPPSPPKFSDSAIRSMFSDLSERG